MIFLLYCINVYVYGCGCGWAQKYDVDNCEVGIDACIDAGIDIGDDISAILRNVNEAGILLLLILFDIYYLLSLDGIYVQICCDIILGTGTDICY